MGRVIRGGRLEIRLRTVTVGVMPISVRVLVYPGRRPAAGVVFAGAKLYIWGIFEVGADIDRLRSGVDLVGDVVSWPWYVVLSPLFAYAAWLILCAAICGVAAVGKDL